MFERSIWVRGRTRSGKTQRLCQGFRDWVINFATPIIPANLCLVLAANESDRRQLADRLAIAVDGRYPVQCKTPLGFISEEVLLFWPLILEQAVCPAQFPLRLRPETEQALATALWRKMNAKQETPRSLAAEYRLVRDSLDVMQLGGAAGLPLTEISTLLTNSWPDHQQQDCSPAERGRFLLAWRQWCLEQGFLTYGLIYDLYWQYLLPQEDYQARLQQRFTAVFADDLDDYPVIAADLIETLLEGGAWGLLTYNLDGKIRLGLNADPDYLATLASYCQIEALDCPSGLAADWGENILTLLTDPLANLPLPPTLQSLQTTSRAKLLRTTANLIIETVKDGEIKPEEIAIIAPGLDDIARYSLIEMLTAAQIPIEPLNEQRPLHSSPFVRSLLTLSALVYPDLGRLALRDDVAEMLVILSQTSQDSSGEKHQRLIPAIDPVRAGILADACYQLDLAQPRLLPFERFARWDRLGYQAATAYKSLSEWIEQRQKEVAQSPEFSPLEMLHQAMQELVPPMAKLPYSQVSALRELMETAQHFWKVEQRLAQNPENVNLTRFALADFIQLLRQGTITANPLPHRALGHPSPRIILATIFQYRSLRTQHPWHFWLDAGSELWKKGGASQLFAAPIFQRGWSGWQWTEDNSLQADQERFERIMRDLLARVSDRLYLCHSDLSVRGVEQTGPLLALIQRSPLSSHS